MFECNCCIFGEKITIVRRDLLIWKLKISQLDNFFWFAKFSKKTNLKVFNFQIFKKLETRVILKFK
jgi:hypothetical protein